MLLTEGIDLSQVLGLWRGGIMVLLSFGLFYLAIVKRFEPLLLLPIGVGILLVNIFPVLGAEPTEGALRVVGADGQEVRVEIAEDAILVMDRATASVHDLRSAVGQPIRVEYDQGELVAGEVRVGEGVDPNAPREESGGTVTLSGTIESVLPGERTEPGLFWMLQKFGLATELFPLLMFLGLGALSDFTPMMQRPILVILGAAAQVGIFGTLIGALFLVTALTGGADDPLRVAAAISIIGSADGPTTIFVSSKLLTGAAPQIEALLGPIAISAYTYMAMVPLIQPPIMRLLTTKKERQVLMEYSSQPASKAARVLFPIAVMLITLIVAPGAGPLIGLLMFGNLLKESGVVDRLSQSAQNELINIVTIFLGLAVGSTMVADVFIQPLTIAVFILGLIAFGVATASGVLMGKVLYLVSGGKINPLLGAAGVSAVPMAARVVNQVALEERPDNFLLMHALSPNVAGVLGSAIAAGVLISLVG